MTFDSTTVNEIINTPQPEKTKELPKSPFCIYRNIQINRHLKRKHKLTKPAVYAARKYVIGESPEQLNHKLAMSSHQQISLQTFIEDLEIPT